MLVGAAAVHDCEQPHTPYIAHEIYQIITSHPNHSPQQRDLYRGISLHWSASFLVVKRCCAC